MDPLNLTRPADAANRRRCLRVLLAWGGTLALPAPLFAQAAPADIDLAGRAVTSAQIVEALKQPQGARRTRTRRLQLAGEAAPEAGSAEAAPAARAESPRLSFDQITFAFASAQLSPDAAVTLKAMGEALTSPQLTGLQFLIEGHTDSVGGLEFNMRLSVRRADAVKRFLIAQYGVDADRLFIAGKGPTELRDPAHPEAGINRRVVLQSFIEGRPAG